MFRTSDDKFFMLGRKKDDEYEWDQDDDYNRDLDKYIKQPGGELREMQMPEDCNDIQKVAYFEEIIVLLTREGKLFINGSTDIFEDSVIQTIDVDDDE